MAGQHENAGADDGADAEGDEAGRRQRALERHAAMGDESLDLPFLRLRLQRGDRLPSPEIGHGDGPSKVGRPCRAAFRLPPSVRDASEFVQFRPASARFSAGPAKHRRTIGGNCKIWAKCWSEWQDLRLRPLLIDFASRFLIAVQRLCTRIVYSPQAVGSACAVRRCR